MDLLILWFGFAGAWLLFAGPFYQAAIELREQDIEREHINEVQGTLKTAPPVSGWWWLLPPVKFYLEFKQAREYRQLLISKLSPEVVEQLIAFISKATGWLMVGLGGFFIALRETYALLAEGYSQEGLSLFLAVAVGMTYISIAYTVVSVRRIAAHKARA